MPVGTGPLRRPPGGCSPGQNPASSSRSGRSPGKGSRRPWQSAPTSRTWPCGPRTTRAGCSAPARPSNPRAEQRRLLARLASRSRDPFDELFYALAGVEAPVGTLLVQQQFTELTHLLAVVKGVEVPARERFVQRPCSRGYGREGPAAGANAVLVADDVVLVERAIKPLVPPGQQAQLPARAIFRGSQLAPQP